MRVRPRLWIPAAVVVAVAVWLTIGAMKASHLKPDQVGTTFVGALIASVMLWGFVELFVVGPIRWFSRVSSGRPKERVHVQADIAALPDVQRTALQPIVPATVVRNAGETFYFQQAAELFAVQTHSEWVGGSSGASLRVAKGVYLRSSGTRGHSQKRDSWDLIDKGTLYLSDQRVLFIGLKAAEEFPFRSIAALEPFQDGFTLMPKRGKRIGFTTGDYRAGVVVHRLINGDLGAHPLVEGILEPGDSVNRTSSS